MVEYKNSSLEDRPGIGTAMVACSRSLGINIITQVYQGPLLDILSQIPDRQNDQGLPKPGLVRLCFPTAATLIHSTKKEKTYLELPKPASQDCHIIVFSLQFLDFPCVLNSSAMFLLVQNMLVCTYVQEMSVFE